METIFFLFLFLTAYPYIIFPLLVITWAKIKGQACAQGKIRPKMSVIMSLFNEERVIQDKIDNTLSLSYPENLLEVVIVSDGSTDKTNEIVSSCKDRRIIFKPISERRGKTSCLNLAVAEASGDILVFTDANSMFPSDVIDKIARNFTDESVGLVTGWTKYRHDDDVAESVGLYAKLEMVTKHAESMISSCVGADGAIFAMRKHLYQALNDGDINDFVIPLNVVSQGKRVILDPEVYCIEKPGDDKTKEYRRQVRITNRTLGAIYRNIYIINPIRFRSYSFFIVSHKIVRFMLPFSIAALFIIALTLINTSPVYGILLLFQILFLAIGIGSNYEIIDGRIPRLCSFFIITIAAQFVGWIRWASGNNDVMWKPER